MYKILKLDYKAGVGHVYSQFVLYYNQKTTTYNLIEVYNKNSMFRKKLSLKFINRLINKKIYIPSRIEWHVFTSSYKILKNTKLIYSYISSEELDVLCKWLEENLKFINN